MQQGDSFFYKGYMVYIVEVLQLPTNVPASAHRATLQQRFLIFDALTSIQKQETVFGFKIFAKLNVGIVFTWTSTYMRASMLSSALHTPSKRPQNSSLKTSAFNHR